MTLELGYCGCSTLQLEIGTQEAGAAPQGETAFGMLYCSSAWRACTLMKSCGSTLRHGGMPVTVSKHSSSRHASENWCTTLAGRQVRQGLPAGAPRHTSCSTPMLALRQAAGGNDRSSCSISLPWRDTALRRRWGASAWRCPPAWCPRRPQSPWTADSAPLYRACTPVSKTPNQVRLHLRYVYLPPHFRRTATSGCPRGDYGSRIPCTL